MSLYDLVAGTSGVSPPPAYIEGLSPEANAAIGAVRQPVPTAPDPAPAPAKRESVYGDRHGFLDTVGKIGDVLSALGGGSPVYLNSIKAMQAQHEQESQRNALADIYGDPKNSTAAQAFLRAGGTPELLAKTREFNTPKIVPIGNAAVSIDQNAGTATPVYQGETKPTPIESALRLYASLPDGSAEKQYVAGFLAKQGYTPPSRPIATAEQGFVRPEEAYGLHPYAKPVASGGTGGGQARFLSADEKSSNGLDPSLPYQIDAKGLARLPVGFKPGAGGGGAQTGGAVENGIGDLRTLYQNLDKGGGSVNTNHGVVANLRARLANSGLGQQVAGAFGTNNQNLRDQISALVPGVVQDLAHRTGMTAKQLDSNADVKLALSQLGDPTRSVQANLATLDRLDKRFPKKAATTGWSIQKVK